MFQKQYWFEKVEPQPFTNKHDPSRSTSLSVGIGARSYDIGVPVRTEVYTLWTDVVRLEATHPQPSPTHAHTQIYGPLKPKLYPRWKRLRVSGLDVTRADKIGAH